MGGALCAVQYVFKSENGNRQSLNLAKKVGLAPGSVANRENFESISFAEYAHRDDILDKTTKSNEEN